MILKHECFHKFLLSLTVNYFLYGPYLFDQQKCIRPEQIRFLFIYNELWIEKHFFHLTVSSDHSVMILQRDEFLERNANRIV